MARSLWSGSLSFGLVNVPVRLLSAVRDADVHFHQLHEKDGARIEVRRFCTEEDVEVAYEDIGHGYELDDGTQVVLTDEELATVAPERTRTIDIDRFVPADAIDPVHLDHPYWLLPSGQGEGALRAYRLLVSAMEQTDRVAVGRVVLRTKEYLVALRVREGRLALSTMLFGDEVRDGDEVAPGGRRPAKKEVDAAVELVEAATKPWRHEDFRDCYTERLRAVIERKQKGERVRAPKASEAPAPPTDVLEALARSLRAVRGGHDGGAGDGNGNGGSGRFDRGELSDLSKDELYERAQDADVPGRSSMTKDELVDALTTP